MSFLRPAAAALVTRWAEVAIAGLAMAAGLWLMARGGWVLVALGGVLLFLAAQWAWIAWRRLRFARPLAAPGLVEVDEGAIRYLAPRGGVLGGAVSLREVAALRLIRVSGGRLWQIKDSAGQMLLIPVDAKGAEALFDAFATLPGIDMGAVLRALDDPAGPGLHLLWRRR